MASHDAKSSQDEDSSHEAPAEAVLGVGVRAWGGKVPRLLSFVPCGEVAVGALEGHSHTRPALRVS